MHHKCGASQDCLSTVARNIWSLQVSLGVHLEVQHIAGKLNTTADALSRFRSEAQLADFRHAHPGIQVTLAFADLCALNENI